MPSGGHLNSGPPPDPNALRRERDKLQWRQLPRSGRKGAPPAWPLTEASEREMRIWKRVWQRPQAIMWEANGQADEVAVYVRTFAEAEKPMAATRTRDLMHKQMDALGITLPGMLRNRWTIVDDTDVPKTQRPTRAGSSKTRLRAIEGGAA